MLFDAPQQGLLSSKFAQDNVFHIAMWISLSADAADGRLLRSAAHVGSPSLVLRKDSMEDLLKRRGRRGSQRKHLTVKSLSRLGRLLRPSASSAFK